VIAPRFTVSSDSRCRGVTPTHEHSCLADLERDTSPISPTKTAANTGRVPSMR